MKSIIQKIVHSQINYAKFLNTLSLLEYIGARKILKSQHQVNINEKMLAHAAEELRHAKILKKASLKLAPGLCCTYQEHELLCGSQAMYYFQFIDRAVKQHLNNNDSFQAYLFTTYLIEQRSISFYTQFDLVLLELEKSTQFRGIIVEEDHHLNEIISCLKNNRIFIEDLNILLALEHNAFLIFMNAVENVI